MDKKTREQQHIAREELLARANEALTAPPWGGTTPLQYCEALSRSVIEYLNAEKAVEADDALPTARREAILKVTDYVAACYLRAHPGEVPSTMKFFDVTRWFTNLPATLLSKALQVPDVPETTPVVPRK